MQVALLFEVYQYSSHFGVALGTSLVDLSTRVDLNAPGLTGVYWLWTNTYYLYTLFILTLWLTCLNLIAFSYSIGIFLLLLYVTIMAYEIRYNINMIEYLQPTEDNMAYYNLLLNNCINKVHPMLIYASWIMLVSYFLFTSVQQRTSYRFSTLMNKTASLMFTTLVLGGWWAYQEGSWGGWWNWDPSEMFGLLILGALLIFSHVDTTNSLNLITYAKNIALSLLMYYCFLQLNFSLISHNFGIRQGDLVDFRIFYSITFIMLSAYVFSKNKNKDLWYLLNIKKPTRVLPTLIITYVLLASVTYFSTLELWASLTWNILNLDIQHYLDIVPTLNIALLAAIYLNYSKVEAPLVALVVLCSYFSTPLANIVVITYLYSFSLVKFKNLHITMILALLVLVTYSSHTYTTNPSHLFSAVLDSVSCNLPLLHLSTSTTARLDDIAISQASSLTLNSIELKLFNLKNSAYSTLQNYSISNEDVLVNSVVSELYNLPITSIMFLFYYIYSNYSVRALIIRF